MSPAFKGQKYNIEPRPRIKKVFQKVLENNGKSVSKAMEGIYPESTRKNPQQITRSKGWNILLKREIKDEKLVNVLNEGLDAGKKIFRNNNETKEIEEVGYDADYATRHKYLETGLKLKGYYPKEGNQTAIQINVNKFKDYE